MGELSREGFRAAVFARDGGRCVICGAPAADAHHIMERRLFSPEGLGYDTDNGASLCPAHHLAAEQTTLTCTELRAASGITRVALPEQLYADAEYDKWGNTLLADGLRSPGELFWDPSVQQVLGQGGVLPLFRYHVRHPRTYHLPWSLGATRSDRMMPDTSALEGVEVVATLKLDGEQTSFYHDYIHARSLDWHSHPSRDWVKALWARTCADIPPGWHICGENMWAVHSIAYSQLASYFYVHSAWDAANFCLSWDETQEWAALLGLQTVPVLYRGPFDPTALRRLWTPAQADTMEGYVVRPAAGFAYRDWRRLVGKFVRPGHVQSAKHWFQGAALTRNRLA